MKGQTKPKERAGVSGAVFTDKLLQEALQLYKDTPRAVGETVELELRFKDITRDVFETIYTVASGTSGHEAAAAYTNPRLECSINIISENIYERAQHNNVVQYIRKMAFNGTVVASEQYMTKTRIVRPIQLTDYLKYSVSLAKEAPTKKFSTAAAAMVRFKARMSFDYAPVPGPALWRLDLTAVKRGPLSELGAALKKIKDELFASVTAGNFAQSIPHDMIDQYEVELEYIGARQPTMDDLQVSRAVFGAINPQYLIEIAYQEEIHHVAEYIVQNTAILHLYKQPSHRLKQLGNQAIAISKNTYGAEVFPPVGLLLTEKADGVRCIVSINGGRCRLLKSDTMLEFGALPAGEVTIADAEMIARGEGTIPDQVPPFSLRVFDVMVLRDENISKLGLARRIEQLDAAVSIISKFVPSTFAAKYVELGPDSAAQEASFRAVWGAPHDYAVDGLIMSTPGDSYAQTRNYKWKPYELNTIDFLAVKCPQKLLGIKPYVKAPGHDLYILFVGINHQMREKIGLGLVPYYKSIFPSGEGYYPVQFSPSANPLAYLYQHPVTAAPIDRLIVELSMKDGAWLFHRVRTDRTYEKNYFGNDFRVAELTYVNYIDPFGLEDLWTKPSNYFATAAASIHTAPNKFKRYFISAFLQEHFANMNWVIDEAAGRGADLHRYQEINVQNALFIDIDPTAISELIRRKFAFFALKKRHIRERVGGVDDPIAYDKLIVKDVKSLTVHTLVADLTTPYSELCAATFQYGISPGLVSGIVCNFALHYLCDTMEHLRNLLTFNAKMLKVGGLFMFTVMNGRSVFDLLADVATGQQWQSREGEVLKYAVRKDYVGTKLAATGQMISVLLPFADTLVDEPLCNVETVVAEGRKLGFELEFDAPMVSYMDKFARAESALYAQLTEEDRKYIGLFRCVSMRLVKPPRQ